MKKVYELNLNDLLDNLPKSQYDKNKQYINSEFICINKDDKYKFMKEYTQLFKTTLKQLLAMVYECESCQETHINKYEIYKCKCGKEICIYCETELEVCEECYDKEGEILK